MAAAGKSTPAAREHHRRRGRGAARPPCGAGAAQGRKFALEPLTGETHDAPRLASGLRSIASPARFVRGS